MLLLADPPRTIWGSPEAILGSSWCLWGRHGSCMGDCWDLMSRLWKLPGHAGTAFEGLGGTAGAPGALGGLREATRGADSSRTHGAVHCRRKQGCPVDYSLRKKIVKIHLRKIGEPLKHRLLFSCCFARGPPLGAPPGTPWSPTKILPETPPAARRSPWTPAERRSPLTPDVAIFSQRRPPEVWRPSPGPVVSS